MTFKLCRWVVKLCVKVGICRSFWILGLELLKHFLLSLRLNLRKLILISTVLSVSGLFVVSVFILNYAIKQQLIQNSLSVNEKYAEKIATSANQHFTDMLKELEYSAKVLEKNFYNIDVRGFVAQRFEMQSAPNWAKFKA